jgi:hypothetical protein
MTPEERAEHWARVVRGGAPVWVRRVGPSLAAEIRAAEIAALEWAAEWAARGDIQELPCTLPHGPGTGCEHDAEEETRALIEAGIRAEIERRKA